MTQRLPTPGGDNGDWGDILNDFLDVSHNPDGTLAANTVGQQQLQNNSVGTNQLQNNSVTNTQLDTATQAAITKANSAVQTSQLGTANGIAQLDGNSTLEASQLPSSVVSGTNIIDICRVAGCRPGDDITSVLQEIINEYASSEQPVDIYASNPGTRSNPYLLEGAQQTGTWVSSTVTTTLASQITLPTSNIPLASVTNFTPATAYSPQQAMIGGQLVTYIGISGNTLIGCTGGTGTIAVGAACAQAFTYSGQILIPGTNFTAGPNIPIRIHGLNHGSGGLTTTGAGNGGLCIATNATSGFVFASVPAESQWNFQWSGIKPVFEDVVIIAPNNPQIGVIDARTALRFKWLGEIDTWTAWQSVTGSNTPGSKMIALWLPFGYNNGDIEVAGEIHGFPIAVNLTEHCWFPKLDISNCGSAFQRTCVQGEHANQLGYVDIEECGIIFDLAGTAVVNGNIDMENVSGSGWQTQFSRFYDSAKLVGEIGLYVDEGGDGSLGGGSADGAAGTVQAIIKNLGLGTTTAATHPSDNFIRQNGGALASGQGPGLCNPTFHPWRTTGLGIIVNQGATPSLQSTTTSFVQALVRAKGINGEPRRVSATFVVGATFEVGVIAQRTYNSTSKSIEMTLNNGNLLLLVAGTTVATINGVVPVSSTVTAALEIHYQAGLPSLAKAFINGILYASFVLTAANQASLLPTDAEWIEDGVFFQDETTTCTSFVVSPTEQLGQTLAKATATHTAQPYETTLCTSGTFTTTIPAPSAETKNDVINNGSGTITVAPSSGTLYNLSGATGNISLTQGERCSLLSDGTNWYQVS